MFSHSPDQRFDVALRRSSVFSASRFLRTLILVALRTHLCTCADGALQAWAETGVNNNHVALGFKPRIIHARRVRARDSSRVARCCWIRAFTSTLANVTSNFCWSKFEQILGLFVVSGYFTLQVTELSFIWISVCIWRLWYSPVKSWSHIYK